MIGSGSISGSLWLAWIYFW